MAIPNTYQWNNNGTKQSDRLPKALSNGYVKIDERSFDDLLAQMAEYAKRLDYFDVIDEEIVKNGDWTDFFRDVYDYEKHKLKKERIEALIEEGDIPPHMALIMAFLKMYEVEQANLNTLTEKHLQLYYKEILGFKPRKGENGNATVFFEPVKNAPETFIPKGTLFDAGKDANGKPITYRSVKDVTVNQIKVAEFFKGLQKTNTSEDTTNGNSATSSQNNSRNGLTTSNSISKAQQKLGFAISSPILNLPDGQRTITLQGCKQLPNRLFIEFTGEKGWEKAEYQNNTIIIGKNQGAIVPYNAKIHGEGFDSPNPVLRFLFSTNVQVINYNGLGVSVVGSRDFTLKNDYGAFPNSNGAMPWGPQPLLNSSFTLTPNKKTKPNTVHIHWVNDNSRNTNSFEKQSVLKQNKPTSGCLLSINDDASTIKLVKDLGWSKFTSNLVEQSQKLFIKNWLIYGEDDKMAKANKITVSLPNHPYTPIIAEPITIDYTINDASTNNNKSSAQLQLITPFGIQKPKDSNSFNKALEMFNKQKDSLSIKLEGVFASGTITLYFKMHPFKYNPNGQLGDESPSWYYYTRQGWQEFANDNIISDTTEFFKHSGIVQLKIDEEIVAETQKDKGSLGLVINCRSTGNPFDALEEVRTQAVEVEPDPLSEGQIETGAALPLNSISKAKTNIKGIKKIEQPYPGKEGRTDETDDKFYTRVSEKLRHKGRAWSSWDYERLVLEKFPKVASVKCLPCYNCQANGQVDMEPGHVTLVVVPDCQAIPQSNPLRPTIGKAMEKEIADYISSKAPSFIQLHVVSPTYKEAKVHCNITLRKGITDTNHYKNLINARLVEFLAPWSSPETPEIEFKTNQNESHIQEFIEHLECVDHFDGFRLTIDKDEIAHGTPLQPDDVTSIITSVGQHNLYVQIFEK